MAHVTSLLADLTNLLDTAPRIFDAPPTSSKR
jgi:hypothetical protein